MNKKQFELAQTIGVIEEVLSSGGEFKLYPRGTSMLPFIVQDEDSVILKRADGPLKRHDVAFYRRANGQFVLKKGESNELKRHDIAFYRRKSGQFVLHRVMNVEPNGTYVMCGDNQINLERGIEDSQIIGVMSALYKKESLFDQTAFSHKLYRTFWCCITLRKIIRFPKRCVNKLLRMLKVK